MLQALKKQNRSCRKSHYTVQIEYHTPRGKWYSASWKGDVAKSGGLATNIGIHLFDLAVWLFEINKVFPEKQTALQSKGTLQLQHATIQWNLKYQGHKKKA